jgi:hypothetical protein
MQVEPLVQAQPPASLPLGEECREPAGLSVWKPASTCQFRQWPGRTDAELPITVAGTPEQRGIDSFDQRTRSGSMHLRPGAVEGRAGSAEAVLIDDLESVVAERDELVQRRMIRELHGKERRSETG